MFRRILALIALAAMAFAAITLITFPKWSIGQLPSVQQVTVQPKQPTLVCPGPVFVNGGANGETIGTFSPSGSATVFGVDGAQRISNQASTELTLTGTASGSANFNAVQTQDASNKQVAGFAAANCEPGTNDAWLVAGDNSLGREALIVLANPSQVDATVSLELYGASGLIQGAGLSGISAPGGKVTVLPLASFAPKAQTFSIRVSSRGAQLGVWLQQKTVRGLTPGGLDLVAAAAMPAKSLDIPGLFLRNTDALTKLNVPGADFSDSGPMLRLTNPGTKDASFTAQVQGADGSSFGTVIQGTIPAYSSKDFPLSDLSDGDYSVHVQADSALVGAARFSRMNGSLPDFAWAPAVAPSKLSAGFTVPTGVSPKLSVSNPNSVELKVTLSGKTYSVPANSSSVLPISAGQSYSITSDQPASVSQVLDSHGGIAVLPVLDYRGVGGTLKVEVR